MTLYSPAGAVSARYGTAMPPANGWNDVLETMLGHRSVRAYLPDALAPGTLETLIAAAQSAPTSSNLQAWSVVAVEDAARKARLAVTAGNQRHIEECPLFLLWVADLARLAEVGRMTRQPTEALDYLELFLLAALDAGFAAQNAVVAAESLGLGTVYIGAMRNQPEAVAAEIGLPPGAFVVFGLCVGHPDPARPATVKPRLPQSTVLHRETYDLARQPPGVGDYDRVMRAFYQAQGMTAPDWSSHSAKRVGNPAALTGRHRLREALEALGFPLL